MSIPTSEHFDSSKIRRLERMLDLDAPAQSDTWLREEYSAILEHQLAASLETELVGIDSQIESKLEAWRRLTKHPLKQFSDLLAHPQPPMELLNTAKRFAKRAKASADGFLPDEVATVLYFVFIAAGMVRGGAQISRMEREKLQRGLMWAAGQDWVAPPIKSVVEEAVMSLGSKKPEGPTPHY